MNDMTRIGAGGRYAAAPQAWPQNALEVGTPVLTLDGELPVEHLAPGDRIITRDSGMAVLRAINVAERRVGMVRVAAGSLGHTRPEADTILPATQQVLIRDWRAKAIFGRARALMPAARLVDGRYVTHAGTGPMRLVALHFDAPHILYAGGLEIAAAEPVPHRATS